MFEELLKEEQREERQERKKLVQMTAYVVAALVVVGAIIYLASGRHARAGQPLTSAAAAALQTPPDAVRDLKLARVRMGKDSTGLRVKWSVQLTNKSNVYTYSDIRYGAYLLDPNGARIGGSEDTIKDSIGPGEEKAFPEFVGGIYNPNASTYQFVIKGATATHK